MTKGILKNALTVYVYTMKVNGVQNSPNGTDIFQNTFFCVTQKKVSRTGLEWQ